MTYWSRKIVKLKKFAQRVAELVFKKINQISNNVKYVLKNKCILIHQNQSEIHEEIKSR